MRISLTTAVLLTALLASPVAGSDEEWSAEPPDPATVRALGRAVGNPDPGALRRLAGELAPPQLMAACYRGTRTERLTALEVVAYLPDPWPALPFLAAVMGSRDRQGASRAAGSLLTALSRIQDALRAPADLVPGQAEQLAGQLLEVAGNARLDPDLRASALAAVALLTEIDGRPRSPDPDLLEDPETAVREASLALFSPPLADDQLAQLARLATADDDLLLRGQAAGLLCENALAHGVTAPSPDLRKLLLVALRNPQAPAEALGSILGCLARFPAPARADLIEIALRHPDPAVKGYWEELTGDSH